MPAVVQATVTDHKHDATLVNECRTLTKCASTAQQSWLQLELRCSCIAVCTFVPRLLHRTQTGGPSACRLALYIHWQAAVAENSKQPNHGLEHQIYQHSYS